MKSKEQVYRQLQKHLNNQAVGFPATLSGVELKILKHIFNPKQAEIACYLNYQFEAVETIYQKVKHLIGSMADLEEILDSTLKRGGIEQKFKNGSKHYACIPLVFGMYEFQNDRLTSEFRKDIKKYFSTTNFGIEFLSTKLPQMRTIPVSKSIQIKHNVSRFDEVEPLLKAAQGPFVVVDCICRKEKALDGSSCKVTDRKETCLGVGHLAQMSLNNNVGREITREEAISILDQNQKEGLVLQPSNTKKAEFICSCCGCCCGMLRLHKSLPIPLKFWTTNFYAVVDSTTCVGCGACEGACQVRAIRADASAKNAYVDRNRCLGCGLCVASCPKGAITIAKRSDERIPPQNREELYDIIMENKKGKLEKLILAGTLLVDSIRTR